METIASRALKSSFLSGIIGLKSTQQPSFDDYCCVAGINNSSDEFSVEDLLDLSDKDFNDSGDGEFEESSEEDFASVTSHDNDTNSLNSSNFSSSGDLVSLTAGELNVLFATCPAASNAAGEPLILRGCHPLPRRRCFVSTPVKLPATLPANPFSPVPENAILWGNYKCKSFNCLNPDMGFDLKKEKSKLCEKDMFKENLGIEDRMSGWLAYVTKGPLSTGCLFMAISSCAGGS